MPPSSASFSSVEEYDDGTSAPASVSAATAVSIWDLCASQRAWASAYCRSHSSRYASNPGSQSLVSGSKPSGYL